MQWTNSLGTEFMLVYKFHSCTTYRFDGSTYVESGSSNGILVQVKTKLQDVFHMLPEDILFTAQQVEDRDNRISNRLINQVQWEDCNCGCNSRKPADSISATWLKAASVVRCEPLE